MVSAQTIKKVSELIRNEEDLNKLNSIKANVIKDKNLIESRLKIEQSNKFTVLERSMDNLQISNRLMKELRFNLDKINKLKTDSMNSIEDYELFDKSSIIYGNFEEVVKIYNTFINLDKRFALLNKLLDYELREEEFEGNEKLDNLLTIHYELTKLLDFKDELLSLSSNNNDTHRIIESSFQELDSTIIPKFDNLMVLISDKSFFENAMRFENFQVIIKWFKIIEFETLTDLKLDSVSKMIRENPATTASREHVTVQLFNTVGRISKRYYKEKLLKHLRNSIDEMFSLASANDDLNFVLNSLNDWYYPELEIYMIGFQYCCPKEWNFFKGYMLLWYQNNLKQLIHSMISRDPENSIILKILDCNYENGLKLKKEFKISKEELPKYEILTAVEKNQILEDYVSITINKSREWFNNTYKTAFEVFQHRSNIPSENNYEKLGIETSSNIYRIISENVNVLIDTNEVETLLKYIEFICKDLLISKVNEWLKIIDVESNKWPEYLKQQDQELEDRENLGLLPRYIVTLANDAVRGINGLTEIRDRCIKLTNSNFHMRINELFEICFENSYINLGNQCIIKLVDYSIYEIAPITKIIFGSKWYNFEGKELIENSLDIINEDYLKELKNFLDPELYTILLEVMLPKYLMKYLNGFQNEDIKLKDLKKFEDTIERDSKLIYDKFSRHYNEEQLNIINEVFKLVIDLITEKEDRAIIDIFTDYKLHKFNDLPLSFLQDLLKNRKDFNAKRLKLVINECEVIKPSVINPSCFDYY